MARRCSAKRAEEVFLAASQGWAEKTASTARFCSAGIPTSSPCCLPCFDIHALEADLGDNDDEDIATSLGPIAVAGVDTAPHFAGLPTIEHDDL